MAPFGFYRYSDFIMSFPSSAKTRPPGGPSTRVAARKGLAPSKIVVPGNRGVKVSRSVTIRLPARPLYAFWRNVENLARVIEHPVTITRRSDIESHWSVSAPPGDRRVEWDAVIINTHEDRLLAWRSREGAHIANAGSVRFDPSPGGEGTEVTVTLEYLPPGGKLGALLARFSGEEAGRQVGEALRRFKVLMETGETSATAERPSD